VAAFIDAVGGCATSPATRAASRLDRSPLPWRFSSSATPPPLRRLQLQHVEHPAAERSISANSITGTMIEWFDNCHPPASRARST
jgi:hypothetical protein